MRPGRSLPFSLASPAARVACRASERQQTAHHNVGFAAAAASLAGNLHCADSERKLVLEYDVAGRLVRRTEYDGSLGNYVVRNDLKFLANGWQCVAELNATNYNVVRSYRHLR